MKPMSPPTPQPCPPGRIWSSSTAAWASSMPRARRSRSWASTTCRSSGSRKGPTGTRAGKSSSSPDATPSCFPSAIPVLYFVQRLRDEAHRFAIGTHRAKRAKSVGATPLDDVPGVGAARKRALLAHFGSAKAVTRAGLEDLKAVDGVSATLAQTIYDHFHDKG